VIKHYHIWTGNKSLKNCYKNRQQNWMVDR